MNNLNWSLKSFQELSNDELYAILRLRADVFVVEQDCVYQDLDNLDQQALHLMAYLNDKLSHIQDCFLPVKMTRQVSLKLVV